MLTFAIVKCYTNLKHDVSKAGICFLPQVKNNYNILKDMLVSKRTHNQKHSTGHAEVSRHNKKLRVKPTTSNLTKHRSKKHKRQRKIPNRDCHRTPPVTNVN
uniref:Uncharacterized protein n=1 Tax=Graphocephala atropunctata TaxID=36148 RepID=A0A1B6M3M0_9HEMI